LTSFGGPVAHLSYFRAEYVERKRWLSEQAYADLVALCQFLPGPASSQVGMAIGLSRAGIPGAVLSWIGFTLPSALILVLFGLGVTQIDLNTHQHWLHGLKVVAVAVVAQAVYGMSKKLCPDKERAMMAICSSALVLWVGSVFTQILVLMAAGVFGVLFLNPPPELPYEPLPTGTRRMGFFFLFLFVSLLILLPLARIFYPDHGFAIFDGFYRAGSLVFGGGHVVLPLLRAEVVPTGMGL
jgi:chromate transporter